MVMLGTFTHDQFNDLIGSTKWKTSMIKANRIQPKNGWLFFISLIKIWRKLKKKGKSLAP